MHGCCFVTHRIGQRGSKTWAAVKEKNGEQARGGVRNDGDPITADRTPTVEKYCGSCTSIDKELFSSDMDSADLRHGRKEIERIGS